MRTTSKDYKRAERRKRGFHKYKGRVKNYWTSYSGQIKDDEGNIIYKPTIYSSLS